jgi:hypothetical protein
MSEDPETAAAEAINAHRAEGHETCPSKIAGCATALPTKHLSHCCVRSGGINRSLCYTPKAAPATTAPAAHNQALQRNVSSNL